VRKIETVRRYRNLVKVFVISAAIVGAWTGGRATNLNLKSSCGISTAYSGALCLQVRDSRYI